MLELIGVPFDRCGKTAGSALGPAALHFADLAGRLKEIGWDSTRMPDAVTLRPAIFEKEIDFDQARDCYRGVHQAVATALERKNFPMVLGGDHSLSIGSVSAAFKHFGDDLAVVWIDAHADLNSPDGSPSGNLHGMPLGLLRQLGRNTTNPKGDQWRALMEEFAPRPLAPSQLAWIGLRDVDASEQATLLDMPTSFAITMYDIDAVGIERIVQGFARWLEVTGKTKVWISFDVDSLDPGLAPGTGTVVRGGLTYREGHYLAERLHQLLIEEGRVAELVGMDVVEVNPIIDHSNETAKIAVEWVASLFGKRIMKGRDTLDL